MKSLITAVRKMKTTTAIAFLLASLLLVMVVTICYWTKMEAWNVALNVSLIVAGVAWALLGVLIVRKHGE